MTLIAEKRIPQRIKRVESAQGWHPCWGALHLLRAKQAQADSLIVLSAYSVFVALKKARPDSIVPLPGDRALQGLPSARFAPKLRRGKRALCSTKIVYSTRASATLPVCPVFPKHTLNVRISLAKSWSQANSAI